MEFPLRYTEKYIYISFIHSVELNKVSQDLNVFLL